MFNLCAKLFIKDYKNYENPKVREGYGLLSGIMGVVLNVLLFIGKFIAGIITGSISITADAFNNLTDASSSVITFVGFRISSRPPDQKHPFGHGKMEYIAGLVVSIFIFVVALELLRSSIERIFNPQDLTFSVLVMVILSVSVLIKLYMFLYNRITSKKIDSVVMKATSSDCINDCISTIVVIISLLIGKFTGVHIDAYAGIFVAIFIFISGIFSAKETISLLIGRAPDKDFVKNIEEEVLKQPGIIGVHDLIVHNYGPGRTIISLHAEVSSKDDVNIAHENIDNAEKVIQEKFNCIASFHTDPIKIDDPRRNALEKMVKEIVMLIDERFSIHDFRTTIGENNVNLIFDLVIPHDTKMDKETILRLINEMVKGKNKNYNVVCNVEHSFSDGN